MRPERQTKLNYRPDIDGLRAVAVLLVFADHLRTRFSGGYIGVDVFFVISGYLISSVILSEMNAGTFSIFHFYERRIRRIFPALLVMMLGVSVLAYRYFVPSELEAYAGSMLAAILSVSNFLFWHQTGYFDAPSALKPLLHTWSLGVEEQFYIFFPLFLVIVRKIAPQRTRAAIWTVAGVTFALACVWVRRDPTAAFFFAPLRAWELLLGTIVSQRYLPVIHGKPARNVASGAGLLLIIVPAMMYTAKTPFPGLGALAPCLGAALLIAAGETGPSFVGNLLAWRPVVFIGLISYSLYLWHWPILVFQRTSSMLVDLPEGNKLAKLAVVIVSLVVATLSWRFVETPFRKGRLRPGVPALFLLNGAAVALLAAIAVGMMATHGLPRRFPANALGVAEFTTYDETAAYRENVCFLGPKSTFVNFDPAVCLASDPSRKQYLLVGDSHGADLYPGLSSVFPELNISQVNTAGCKILLDEVNQSKSMCGQLATYLYDFLARHPVDTVLLSGRWGKSDLPALKRTIDWIEQHGMHVVVFGPAIEYDAPLPRMLAIGLRDHAPSLALRHRLLEPEQLDAEMRNLVRKEWGVRYISAYEDLCAAREGTGVVPQRNEPGDCVLYAEPGVPMLFDTDHFTAQGSVLYAHVMRARGQLP